MALQILTKWMNEDTSRVQRSGGSVFFLGLHITRKRNTNTPFEEEVGRGGRKEERKGGEKGEGMGRKEGRKKLPGNWHKMPLFLDPQNVIHLWRASPGLTRTCKIWVWGVLCRPCPPQPWTSWTFDSIRPSSLWVSLVVGSATISLGQHTQGEARCPGSSLISFSPPTLLHSPYLPCPAHPPHSPRTHSLRSLLVLAQISSPSWFSLCISQGTCAPPSVIRYQDNWGGGKCWPNKYGKHWVKES